MKKIISLVLVVLLASMVAACGSAQDTEKPETPSSNPSSAPDSSETESSQDEPFVNPGEIIEYQAVKGYINHNTAYLSQNPVIERDGFECMDDKNLLFLPKGTTVSSEENFAVYFYMFDENGNVVIDWNTQQTSGQNVMDMNVSMKAGSVTLEKDSLVRFAVKGTLDRIVVTIPEGSDKEWKYSSISYFSKNGY